MENLKKTSKNLNNKQDLIMISLQKFYNKKENKDQIIPIINGQTKKISLRIIDWFVTNYSKKNNIIYYLSKSNKGYSNNASEEYSNPFIVFFRYKSQLSGFQKKFFDPFCRRSRINFYFNEDLNNPIVTTVGQLNFFKWAIENHIISYIQDNIENIEKDMNKNIRKMSPTTKKKSRKSKNQKTKDLNLINSINLSATNNKRRKRRELSVSATKTLNKHKFNVVLAFD